MEKPVELFFLESCWTWSLWCTEMGRSSAS